MSATSEVRWFQLHSEGPAFPWSDLDTQGLADLALTGWIEVTVSPVVTQDTTTPVDGPDSDVIERAARLLHALQWMGDQEDADAAWDRYPITSATRSDYLRTAEALAAAGLLTPSDTFASTKPSDSELDPMPFIWPGGVRSMFSHGDSEPLIFAPRPEFSQVPGDYAPFMAITAKGSLFDREVEKRVADVAERIARALEEAAEKHPNPIVRLNPSDAADIARSHATPALTTEQEIESLAAEIHEAYAYQYDECDHGTYTGGAMHGEPYSMCLINAERIIRRRSNPPAPSPEIPGFEGTRSALDGLTIRKEKTSD